MNPLVSVEWLGHHLHDANVRVADVRWDLFEKGKGYASYKRGHIPGAVFLDMDSDLASPPGTGPGRHPLPTPEAFAETMARAGVRADTHVVAYDEGNGAHAARLWWLLRYFGHANVSLLDGGMIRWVAEDRPLQTEVPAVPHGEFHPHPDAGMLVDKARVVELERDRRALVLDSRLRERYEGKVEPLDPRKGHIPGAYNAPVAGNLVSAEDPRFLSPEELRARFDELGANGADNVVAYCGSGINACQNIFALLLAGYDAQLYGGSWSDWSSDPTLPAITGATPY